MPLEGHDYSLALGVNDDRLAVGSSSSLASSERAAVVWSVNEAGVATAYPLLCRDVLIPVQRTPGNASRSVPLIFGPLTDWRLDVPIGYFLVSAGYVPGRERELGSW
jgi:hypothetical protein